MSVNELDLTQAIKPEIHAIKKESLKRIIFKPELLVETLNEFIKALPNESIVWLTGKVERGDGIVEKLWKCELEYSTPASAETKPEWLRWFVQHLRSSYPDHNLIVEAHRHPLGSRLSPTDEAGIHALNDWNRELYWVMIGCDFELGSYTVEGNNLIKVPWEVEGKCEESRKLKTRTRCITSARFWVKKALQKLRKQK